ATFYAVSAIASGPAGNLTDRIGASAGLRITCAVAAATMFAAALFGRSTAALVVIVGLSGAGNALGTPGSALLIRVGLPERWRGPGGTPARAGRARWSVRPPPGRPPCGPARRRPGPGLGLGRPLQWVSGVPPAGDGPPGGAGARRPAGGGPGRQLVRVGDARH